MCQCLAPRKCWVKVLPRCLCTFLRALSFAETCSTGALHGGQFAPRSLLRNCGGDRDATIFLHKYLPAREGTATGPVYPRNSASRGGSPRKPQEIRPPGSRGGLPRHFSLQITCHLMRTPPRQPFSDVCSPNPHMQLLLRKFVVLTFLLLCLGSGTRPRSAPGLREGKEGCSWGVEGAGERRAGGKTGEEETSGVA